MHLSKEDILRLYGSHIFIVEKDNDEDHPGEDIQEGTSESVEVKPETSGPDLSLITQGSDIVWRMKPDATFALVLSKEEFSDKALTTFLKKCILEAGVNTSWVGFGIHEPEADSWNLSTLPVNQAWVFGTSVPSQPEPVLLGDKQIYFWDSLKDVSQQADQKAMLIQQLSGIGK